MALTDTALKALKPKEKAYVVSDSRGLYAEVLTTGGVIWRFRYRLHGRREKLTLGKYPDLTLKNARLASVHPCLGRALAGPCALGCRLGTASANNVRTIGADAPRQSSDARASLLVSEASLPGLASRSLHV